eukprot:COSAG03_NODE_7429_length_919_cov_14.330488_2_plen_86_part_00
MYLGPQVLVEEKGAERHLSFMGLGSSFGESQKGTFTERDRGTQRETEGHRERQRGTERDKAYRETQGHREPDRHCPFPSHSLIAN